MFLHMGVKVGELVEGHVWKAVMFDMVGHVPSQKAHKPGDVGRPRVLKHIGYGRAVAVFGQDIEAQERLRDHRWEDPESYEDLGPE